MRAPPLYTASSTIHGTPRQKGCDLVFCERLPLSIGMRGPCFHVLSGWTLLGVDAACRHIPVPQAGLGSDIAWPRICKNRPVQMLPLKKVGAMSKDTTHRFLAQAPYTPPLFQLSSTRGGNATILNWTWSLTVPELTETKSSRNPSLVGNLPHAASASDYPKCSMRKKEKLDRQGQAENLFGS